jgi:plasmid stability protein
MQYTIRSIPEDLDRALKARARRQGKSVNQVVVEMLAQGLGQIPRRRSLRDMPGAWSKKEAEELDRFLEEHRRVDDELWE